jgi:uncharacterized membrane protein YfcA
LVALHLDPYVGLAGLIVGLVVGMTGMGGGALMTPILVLVFNVQPLAAVSSDLVASMVMKPVGSAVHLRRGTVKRELVIWLSIGSIPSAFAGVLVIRLLGHGGQLQERLKFTLGAVLLLAAAAIVARGSLQLRRRRAEDAGRGPASSPAAFRVMRLPTLLVGLVGGLVVGMTSVGSGSLIIVALMLLYPVLRSTELVGSDLVQAVPLVASAAIAHLLFGDFRLGITASILVGSIPGVLIGALFSSRSPEWALRPVLIFVLLASGLKLLNLSNTALAIVLLCALAVGCGAVAFYALAMRPGLAEARRPFAG